MGNALPRRLPTNLSVSGICSVTSSIQYGPFFNESDGGNTSAPFTVELNQQTIDDDASSSVSSEPVMDGRFSPRRGLPPRAAIVKDQHPVTPKSLPGKFSASNLILTPQRPTQDTQSARGGGESSSSSRESHWPPEAPGRKAKIFLFVNPTSGGNAAASFTRVGLTHADLTSPDVELFIADIRDGQSARKPAFLQLRDDVEVLKQREKERPMDEPDPIFVVMAGGDGTVLWGISEMWEHHVDDSKVAVAVVPYGTGNDFARALGWEAYNSLNPFNADMKM